LRGNLALATGSLVAALVVSELVLRAVLPPWRGYFVNQPGLEWTATLISSEPSTHVTRVHVNQFGIRGRTFGDDRTEYRILAVGGSTTECPGQDDSTVWTHLVEVGLDMTTDGRRVWVGNVGRNGRDTRDHVLQLKYLLAQYPRIYVVIALVGVNDMQSALGQGWDYRMPVPVTERSAEDAQLHRAFAIVPGGVGLPWYKTTGWWQLLKRFKLAWQRRRTFFDRSGETGLDRARSHRMGGTLIDSLPPLDKPLIEYRRNLSLMADEAGAAGASIVLVTQPTVWRREMTGTEQRHLWMGWLGPDWLSARLYYTTDALRRAMAAYNAMLLDVCRERSLRCVDAAGLLAQDSTVFADDVHFTERGSHLLAEFLVQALGDRPPFPAAGGNGWWATHRFVQVAR
jgi:hypothetical protein